MLDPVMWAEPTLLLACTHCHPLAPEPKAREALGQFKAANLDIAVSRLISVYLRSPFIDTFTYILLSFSKLHIIFSCDSPQL